MNALACATLAAVLTMSVTGCAASGAPLSERRAVSIAESYANFCWDPDDMRQCLRTDRGLREKLDPTFAKIVRERSGRSAAVVTRVGARYALDLTGLFPVAARVGQPVDEVYWRVASIRLLPTSFVERGDTAVLIADVKRFPTPMTAVWQHDEVIAPPAPPKRVTVHYQRLDDKTWVIDPSFDGVFKVDR